MSITLVSAGLEIKTEGESPSINLISPTVLNYSTIVANLSVNNSFLLNGHPDTFFAWNSSLTNYVPYVGATGDVNLGTNGFTTTGFMRILTLDTSGTDIGVLANFNPNSDNGASVGSASYRWSNVYGYTGNFNTLTDGVCTINAGSITGGVGATFSGKVTAGNLTDGTCAISGGKIEGNCVVPTTMDYTNIAMVNKSNVFVPEQNITGNLSVGNNTYIKGDLNVSRNFTVQGKTTLLGLRATAFRYLDADTGGSANLYLSESVPATASGSANAVVGTRAGGSLTSGGYNMLVGSFTGRLMTTGSENMCLGYSSCEYLTTSGENTFVGSGSGRYTGGYGTTGIGASSMIGKGGINGMTGNWNTGIGPYSGYYLNGSSYYNLFMGYHSGYYPRQSQSYRFLLDNLDRIDNVTEENSSMMVGTFSAIRANQKLTLNAQTNISENFRAQKNAIIDGNLSVNVPYGLFSSTATQTIAVANSPYNMTFNTTEESYQIIKSGNNYDFNVSQTGVYEFFISVIGESSVAGKRLDVWFNKNNVNIPRSGSPYDFKGVNAIAYIPVSILINLTTTDTFRVMYGADDTSVTLPYIPATTFSPSHPSVIATIKKISG